MLLCEVTINSILHRVSMEGAALEYFWDPLIISIDPPQYKIANPYGGYVRPGYGSISFSPDLFASSWPPPARCDVTLYYADGEETSRETLFSGAMHLRSITREGISYELFGPSFSAEVAGGTAFDDTLVNVTSWFCDPSRLNLSLDSTYARSPSPAVKFTTARDELAINLLSRLCAFFTHLFYVRGSTLYLVDMFADAGSETLTEFDFFPSEYELNVPVGIVKSANHARTSIHVYGNELALGAEYHDMQANIEAALDDILTIVNRPRCRLRIPFKGGLPNPGKKISWSDSSVGQGLNAYIRARTMKYDFVGGEIVVEGEGVLS